MSYCKHSYCLVSSGAQRGRGGGKGLRYSRQHDVLKIVWLRISALDLRRAGTPATSTVQILSVDQKEMPNKLWVVDCGCQGFLELLEFKG